MLSAPRYEPWMFDASKWSKEFPKKVKSDWQLLAWFAGRNEAKWTPEQTRYYDYQYSILLQRHTGWN